MGKDNSNIISLKEKAREQAKAVRQKLHGSASPSIYSDLSDHLLALLKKLGLPSNSVVAGFWPIGSEIDTRVVLNDLTRRGYSLALPVIEVQNQPLVFRQFETGDELVEGSFKTKQPSVHAPIVEPDIILVPLLAFDSEGGRLGYGGGYYDRTIAKHKALTIGLAFAGQLVRNTPNDKLDMPLDYIVSERGVMGGVKKAPSD